MKFLNLLLFTMTLSFFSSVGVNAGKPSVETALYQRKDAIKLFKESNEVNAAIKAAEEEGFVMLTIDAAPYRFVYGDEGPISWWVVTAWLGKEEAYGWSAKYVVAKVNTDHFGDRGATLVDEDAYVKALTEL